jgi:DNA-binding NarL/FixJ family response regulator
MVLESVDRDLVGNATSLRRSRLVLFLRLSITLREEQVVARVAEGLSNRGMGQGLAAREHAGKKHLFRTFGKLGMATPEEIEVAYQEMPGCKVGRVKPRKQSHQISAQKRRWRLGGSGAS